MLITSLFVSKSDYKEYENIMSSFSESVKIEVIVDNYSSIYNKGTLEYNSILNEFKKVIYKSHQMPALGVSIDNLTREEKKKGVWLEFYFEETGYNSEMPFESLLVQVSLDNSGFNVIRGYDGKYEGRCYYINLVNNMNSLYFYLISNYS